MPADSFNAVVHHANTLAKYSLAWTAPWAANKSRPGKLDFFFFHQESTFSLLGIVKITLISGYLNCIWLGICAGGWTSILLKYISAPNIVCCGASQQILKGFWIVEITIFKLVPSNLNLFLIDICSKTTNKISGCLFFLNIWKIHIKIIKKISYVHF